MTLNLKGERFGRLLVKGKRHLLGLFNKKADAIDIRLAAEANFNVKISDRSDTYNHDIIKELLTILGEDINREGLKDTPKRAIDAWRFWTSGYSQDPVSVLKTFEEKNYDEIVLQSNIPVFSLCEHHLAPIIGRAHIGYIPNGRIIGLSKLTRLLEIFARRLQVQERLTSQIADALYSSDLKPLGVGVVLQCRHLCIETRGIQKIGTLTITSALRGVFREKPEARAEFMSLINPIDPKV